MIYNDIVIIDICIQLHKSKIELSYEFILYNF